MPYTMLEELRSRRKEKVAAFLTFESMVAVMIGAGPLFLISGSWPLIPRTLAILAGGLLGYALTVDAHGQPIYAQLAWAARGALRIRFGSDLITPEQIDQASYAQEGDVPLAVGGPIQALARGGARRPLAALVPQQRTRPADPPLAPASDAADNQV